ncbi:hypothetical protein ACHWQZ_G005800 [Mnemiopsis leidyi]
MIPLLVLTLLSFGSIQSFPTQTANLLVDLVPVIVEAGPGTVSLISGDTLILSCIVRAYPPPTAKIIKLNEDTLNSVDDNHDLDLDLDINTNDPEDTLIEVTLTQRASVEDSGWYRCKATNQHGEAHEDYYVEVFANEDQFYGSGEIGPIDEVIDLVTDFRTTDFVSSKSQSLPTEGTEGTEERTVDPTTPYYMRFF